MAVLCQRAVDRSLHSRHNLAAGTTFRLSQQVVVPFAISVRTQIRRFSSFANNADIRALSSALIYSVVRLRLGLDSSNCGFTGQAPLVGCMANVRDVLMSAITVQLVDAI